MQAYAIAITEDNIRGVIASEAGLNFDLISALKWLDEYGGGWFVRHEGDSLDCQFFMQETFDQIYTFISNDTDELIRPILRI